MATIRSSDGQSIRGRWLSRRLTLRWLGGAGALAAASRLGSGRATASRMGASGLSQAEAETLARGIAHALATDPDLLDEWVAEDVVGHVPLAPDGSGQGLAGLKEKAAYVVTALPDAEITVDELIVVGDTVAAHGEIHGTHRGPLADLPATGASVRAQYVIFARVDDGKITEYWYQLDVLGVLQQLAVFELDNADDSENSNEPTPESDY